MLTFAVVLVALLSGFAHIRLIEVNRALRRRLDRLEDVTASYDLEKAIALADRPQPPAELPAAFMKRFEQMSRTVDQLEKAPKPALPASAVAAPGSVNALTALSQFTDQAVRDAQQRVRVPVPAVAPRSPQLPAPVAPRTLTPEEQQAAEVEAGRLAVRSASFKR